MPVTDDDTLGDILALETIAVVGCSRTEGKAAHDIPAYLLEQGYEIIPVNPFADEIFGKTAYDSLADVPADVDIDLVEVFRPSEEAFDVVEQALQRHDQQGDVSAIWLQLGIRDDTAAARAEEAGLQFVQDRCMKVDHRRLLR